jgi:membrane protease YdiL (CAAX protease family)
MKTLGWLNSLPECRFTPSRSAALWLLGGALLVWPLDIALLKYGERHWVTLTYVENGVRHQTLARPYWVGLSRLGLGVIAVTLLLVCGGVAPRDLGLTVGKPRVTLFWLGFPIAALAGITIIALFGACLFIRVTAWPVPSHWLQPKYIFTPTATWRVVWEMCLISPLVEEVLYRGMPLQALARVCGRGWAVILGGVIWTSLHIVYGQPLALAPVYFLLTGTLFGWIYLQSGSLLPTMALHAICNLVVPVATDLLLLYQGDTVARLLDQS